MFFAELYSEDKEADTFGCLHISSKIRLEELRELLMKRKGLIVRYDQSGLLELLYDVVYGKGLAQSRNP